MKRATPLRRVRMMLLAVAAMVALAVVPVGASTDTVPASDGAPDRALIVRYHTLEDHEGKLVKSIENLKYQPRSFAPGTDVDADAYSSTLVDDAGKYLGWDVLTPPRNWSNVKRNPWLHFTLDRPAEAAIVWRSDAGKPNWLSTWSRSGSVEIDGRTYPVFRKSLRKGAHTLGGPAKRNDHVRNYLVLLAEQNGAPTPDPLVPDNRPAIEPNTLCPQWLHDSYSTVGPDGATYATWHPQIDPTYWCYFGHDHGSDPDIIPGSPKVPYQYVAAKVPQDEPNVGFKEFTFKHGDHYVRIVEHASTAMVRRVCARHHTMFVTVYDKNGNEKFHTGFKADFGAAISASDQSTLTGTTCGYSMEAVRIATNAFRRIRRAADSGSYEVWRTVPTTGTTNLGLVLNHTMDIRDPYSFCPTQACTVIQLHDEDRKQTETRRTLQLRDMEIRAEYALDTGTFHTDPYGDGLVDANATNAVEQYVAPGFSLVFPEDDFKCEVIDPWNMRYRCDDRVNRVPRSNLEWATVPMTDGDLPDVTVTAPMCNGHLATITGSAGDDELFGTPLDDVIVGRGGNDLIEGRGGNDIICGGDGKDRIYGNGGRDQLYGGAGKDRLFGGKGQDVLYGGTQGDRINGGTHHDVVAGQRGSDTAMGRAGNDLLLGGPNDDTLAGEQGADVIRGQGGTDACSDPGDTLSGCE